MPPVAKVGVSTVNGGVIIGPGAPTVLVEGVPTACVGDKVAAHSPFFGEHLAATIVSGSTTVKVEGRQVAFLGSICSCGHTVDSTCAVTVEVGL